MSKAQHQRPSPGDRAAALRALEEGQTLGQIRGLTPQSADMIYALAVARFRAGRLQEAEVCLRFLCAHCADESDFWIALARVARKKGDLHQALSAYFVAFVVQPSAALSLEMATLYQAEGEIARARECIEGASDLLRDHPDETLAASLEQFREQLDAPATQ